MNVAEALRAGRVRRRRSSEAVTVATTGTLVLAPNPNRVSFDVSNLDASNYAVVADRPVTAATAGRRVAASGGYYSAKYEELGQAVGDALYGAFDTAQGTLYVTEWEVF